MGINWGSVIGTVATTAGTVLGKLFGVAGENRDVQLLYSFQDQGEAGKCEASFTRMNGKLVLWNRSEDPHAVVTLAVPKVGSLQPQTFSVPQGGTLEVEQIFRDCADYDSTRLMLSASNSNTVVQNGLAAPNDLFHICAAASDVPADGNTATRLGSYLTVVCYNNRAIFTSANHTIHNLTVVNLQGRNDQRVKMMDIPSTQTASGTVVEIFFPSSFPDGTVLDIDVEADMGGLAKILEEQKGWCTIHMLTNEENSLLRSKSIIH